DRGRRDEVRGRRQIHAAIVHVGCYPLAVDDTEPEGCEINLDDGASIDAPTQFASAWLVVDRSDGVEAYLAHEARQGDVAPWAPILDLRRQGQHLCAGKDMCA